MLLFVLSHILFSFTEWNAGIFLGFFGGDFFFVSFLLEHVSVQCNKYFIFKKKLPLTQSPSLSLTLASYWIGLSDIIQEGTYVWQTTQQRPDFADWGSGEPNDLHHNEDCIELYQVKNFHWNDAPCSVKSKFICEIT